MLVVVSPNHSAETQCEAKYIPAEAAREYVIAELRKLAMSDEEIARVMREVNEQQDERLDRLAQQQWAIRHRLREVEVKIVPIMGAVEAGGNFRSFKDRLAELEQDRAGMEEELTRFEMEADSVRQETLSVEVMGDRVLPRLPGHLGGTEGCWRGSGDQGAGRPLRRGPRLASGPRGPAHRHR